jgi:hypothetical protein
MDLLNPSGATVAPKDDAINKMCYYFFSFDAAQPQPRLLWEILQAYADRYSTGIRGTRSIVSPFQHMIRASGNPNPPFHSASNSQHIKHQFQRRVKATASALFAIELWRVICYLLYVDRTAFSIPVESYIRMNRCSLTPIEFYSISDASPYRICAAIYHQVSNTLAGWTSILLPYPPDTKNSFQVHREYIGHLISILLLMRLFPRRASRQSKGEIPFQWINDNLGALAWADKNKVATLPSIVANMAVSASQLLSNVSFISSTHLPGVNMEDIDRESRREENRAKGNLNYAPTLLSHLYVDLESCPPVMDILSACNPSNPTTYVVKDYHSIYKRLHKNIQLILLNK